MPGVLLVDCRLHVNLPAWRLRADWVFWATMGHSPGHGPRRAAIIDAMATFSGPVTVGTIIEPACLTQCDLSDHGYVEEEFFAHGDACGYDLAGEAASDGTWTAVAAESAP